MSSSSPEIYNSNGRLLPEPSSSRRAERALRRTSERIEVSTMSRSLAIAAEADVLIEKLAAVGAVTRAAQIEAGLMRLAAKNIEQMRPESSADVAALADTGVLLMSEMLVNGARRIGRQ